MEIKRLSQKHKENISKSMKGKEPWNKNKKGLQKSHRKGLTLEKEYGREKAKEIRKKLSKKRDSMRGNKNPSKRIEVIEKIREKAIGRILKKETKNKMSIKKDGNKNPNWLNGKSFEPYSIDFRENKKKINHSFCFLCGKENKQIQIHHSDYDKKNSKINNLVPLCSRCHGLTNYNRKMWIVFFNLLRKGHIWSPSYYIGTAGTVTAETIRRYIQEQEKGNGNSSPEQVQGSPCQEDL